MNPHKLGSVSCTPWKTNMEPENHPCEKEKTSSKPSFLGSILNFGGVMFWIFTFERRGTAGTASVFHSDHGFIDSTSEICFKQNPWKGGDFT